MMSPTNDTPATKLRLSLACDLGKVRALTGLILDFLASEGLSDPDLKSCELALAEACNNAVLYARGPACSLPIEVEAICSRANVELRVSDHTNGFTLPEKIELPDENSESGRGLFIIGSLMDKVNYINGSSKNTLVMRRRRQDSTHRPRTASTLTDFSRERAQNEQIIREMAAELNSCYESLSAIFRCGAELGKTNNLEQFSHRLCQDLAKIVGADWFVLRIAVEDESRLIVFTASEEAFESGAMSLPKNGEGAICVEVQAATGREDVWFDARHPFAPGDPMRAIDGPVAGMVHPCFFGQSLIGTLAIGRKSREIPFSAAQTNIIHTFADFLAIQIVNARLREEHVGHRLISHELQIAKTIQRALLPKSLPKLPGFQLAGYCESARQVGGDFYDVLTVDEHTSLLIIADVMGKGIPAAIFAAVLRSVLRAAPEMANQPGTLLARVNRLMFSELSDVEMFITAALVFVDVKERRLVAASAGHCPLFLTGRNQVPRTISPDGLPLGILPDAHFSEQVETLPDECRLLLYTDGLTDTQNGDGDFFGQSRLLSWLQGAATGSADKLKEELAGQLRRFQAHASLYDDQTFLILCEQSVSVLQSEPAPACVAA